MEHGSTHLKAPWRRRRETARRCCGAVLLVGVAVAAAAALPAEDAVAPDPWGPLRLLEGTWEGEIDGRLGEGQGIRRYDRVLNGVYLYMRHASLRQPQEKSPKGDYHHELAVYSYDRERETVVLREFYGEGYAVRSTCAVEPKRVVCTSESVESGSGMRARLTLKIGDRYRFEEVFELAAPGEELPSTSRTSGAGFPISTNSLPERP